MKKQFLVAVVTCLAAVSSFADTNSGPFVSGDVKFQDELVILGGKLVCSGSSIKYVDGKPPVNITPADITNMEYTYAVTSDDHFVVDGTLDGELINIQGKLGQYIDINLKSASDYQGVPYSFTSSGSFTNMTVHNTSVQNADLTVRMNGKFKSIGCSLK